MNVPADRERAHDEVVVGSHWFGWGHHWEIKRERVDNGVHEVLMRRTSGKSFSTWVASWRVQRYCIRSEAS